MTHLYSSANKKTATTLRAPRVHSSLKRSRRTLPPLWHLAFVATLLASGCTFDLPDVLSSGSASDASTTSDASTLADATGMESGGHDSSQGDSSRGEGGNGHTGDCPIGQKFCDKRCVRMDDPDFGCSNSGCSPCGASSPHAVYACKLGACVLITCEPGFGDCDNDPSNGCETDLTNNESHCGACAAPCSTNHTGSVACDHGECSFTCASGYADCNGDPKDGCEADLTSAAHCGSCNFACPSRPNASAYCQGHGTCSYQCNGSGGMDKYENCDGDWSNGCEVHMTGNPDNCGTCGNVCPDPGLPHVHRICDEVIPNCTGICDPGYYTCDGTWDNGCESTSPCK